MFPTYLCKLIKSFIEDRKFKVFINGDYSTARNPKAGLPQGSCLSPVLYSIFTSDFKVPRYMDIAYYADDTALIFKGKQTPALLKSMEKGLKACHKYFQKWKVQMNSSKTQAIIFPYNKSNRRNPTRNIQLGVTEIPISNDVTYLGVILDNKLNFRKHIESLAEKTIKASRSLYPLIGKNSFLSYKNKNLLYSGVLRPILTSTCPAWSKAAITHLRKLQVIQNKILKIINRLHWRFPTAQLHTLTGFETITEYIRKLTTSFEEKSRSSCHTLIVSSGEPL